MPSLMATSVLAHALRSYQNLCGWCVVGRWVVVESKFSDPLWLSFSLARPNKMTKQEEE